MVNFFIKHKKVRGVITVFLTLIYLSVYLLIGVFVDGGRVRMAGTVVEDIQQIATENVMSQYNRGLYEYYGLFGVSNYEVDQMAKDIKAQIEESVGLKVTEDAVKGLMLDTVNGVNAAISNANILDSDGNVIKNLEDYARKIQSEISDSRNRFNPYGINVKDVTAKYIALSNHDALRAQIRDDMRYEAIMIPTMGFFDNVSKLMEVASGVDTMVKITEKSGSASDTKKKYNEYQNKLRQFSKSLKSLIKETYEVEWKQIDSLKYKTEQKPQEKRKSSGFLDAIFSLFGRKKNNNEEVTSQDNLNHYDEIKTSFSVGNKTDDDKTGLKSSLTSNRDKLNKYCRRFFDNAGDWPEPVYDTIIDENGESHEVYNREAHMRAVREEAEGRASDYRAYTFGSSGSGGKLLRLIRESKTYIEESINLINEYLGVIGGTVAYYESECSKVEDEISKKLFGNQMENTLKQWNDGAEQREVLKRIDAAMSKLMSDSLSGFESDIETTIRAVVSEVDEVEGWRPDTKLIDKRSGGIDLFHSGMLTLVDLINEYESQAEGETQSKHLFQLLDAVTSSIGGKKDRDKSFFEVLDGFGNIEKHYAKKDYVNNNQVFDYAEYLREQKENSENAKLYSFNDDEAEGFNEENIEDKVNAVFTKVNDLISTLTTALFNNIYDETYIITHCRDYVHTYKYREELTDRDKNDDNLDTIFNKKFIEDQSDTKYLTDEQFKNIEVTPAEIEHIIFNLDKSKDEVILMYTSIFAIRLALNLIAVYTGPASKEAKALVLIPFVGGAAAFAAPIACALAQSWIDMGGIMDCKKENLYNKGVHLWDPIVRIADDKINDLMDALATETNKMKHIGTNELLSKVKSKNNDPYDSRIGKAVSTLEKMISDGMYEVFEAGDVDISVSDVANIETINTGGPKAGYTTYLLVFLLVNSFNKKAQISNLQDVIETNMKKAQSDFSLEKTYSQISVESDSTIKYIFMTQSFMKNTFAGTGVDNYNSFPLKIKTAFAY